MSKNETESDIQRCLKMIERQLGWGPSGEWSTYDFTKLSDDVHKRTQVRLSVTTLKRLWGKVKYDNAPTLTTLNALAQFAGYADWREFAQQQGAARSKDSFEENAAQEQQVLGRERTSPTRRLSPYWFLMAIPFIAVAYLLMLSKDKPTFDPDKFQFRADKIKTEGVPNSVVFHYDAGAATTDSVFIVQTWDVRRKKLVSKDNHEHSAIYYYPGFFRTKLLVGGQIVRTHDLWITSDGWLCLAEQEPVPLYFNKGETQIGDTVKVSEELIRKYNLSLHPAPPKIRFFNQRDFGDLMSDNFTFETKLKSDFTEGTGACQPVTVLIQCKDDVIMIPLGAKPCVGNLELYFCGKYVSSADADLSGFGSDLTQWTTLRVEVINKKASLFVNGVKAYDLEFPNNPTGVVGVQYRFSGVGAVKDTWFEDRGRKIPL